jgi:hypothetical protein
VHDRSDIVEEVRGSEERMVRGGASTFEVGLAWLDSDLPLLFSPLRFTEEELSLDHMR